jgi:hypothetical protein
LSQFARPLHTPELAFEFLRNVLQLPEGEADDACFHVMQAEKMLKDMVLKPTLTSTDFRRPQYRGDDRRVILRRKIFDELVGLDRISDDDEIKLGFGGAKPVHFLKAERQAVLLLGLPASGKSAVGGSIADQMGAYIIDSDYAKRKIPEFDFVFGASLVHEESSLITFGSSDAKYQSEFNVYEYCISKGHNMVIPKIGSEAASITRLRDGLILQGYSVHLVLISLDRLHACKRALARFLKTKRYVPLGLVFDGYGNDPILTYYRVRDSKNWASVAKLSTIELQSKGPQVIYSTKNGPIEVLNYPMLDI